jgi:hypothetical protein
MLTLSTELSTPKAGFPTKPKKGDFVPWQLRIQAAPLSAPQRKQHFEKLAGGLAKPRLTAAKSSAKSIAEEYRSRWSARASNPLEGALASSVGSTPASSANPYF